MWAKKVQNNIFDIFQYIPGIKSLTRYSPTQQIWEIDIFKFFYHAYMNETYINDLYNHLYYELKFENDFSIPSM